MRTNSTLKFITMMLAMACLASSNYFAFSKGTPKVAFFSESADEVDEVMQSGKAAIAIINKDIKTKGDELSSLITKLQALLNQVAATEWRSRVTSILKRLSDLEEKLAAPIESISIQDRVTYSKKLMNSVAELKLAQDEIAATESKIEGERQAAIVNLVGSCCAAAAAFGMSAAGGAGVGTGAFSILIKISKDRGTAAKFIEFIHSHNRVALSEMLKRELPGSEVDVREVKDTDGLLAIFRVNGVTHCLSTKTGCGGRSYSVTK